MTTNLAEGDQGLMNRSEDASTSFQHCGITDLHGASIPEDCSSLDLRDNALTRIAELHSQVCLQRLYLGRNVVRDLAPLLSLKQLQVLDLSDNKMESFTGLDSLPALRALNLAGNQLQQHTVTSLRGCSSLSVLDLSRNAISRQEAVLSLLQAQNIQLLCLLGNPLSDSAVPDLPALVIYNSRVLPGKEAAAAGLRRSLPPEAGISWATHSTASSSESRTQPPPGEGVRRTNRPTGHRGRPGDSASSIPPVFASQGSSDMGIAGRSVVVDTNVDTAAAPQGLFGQGASRAAAQPREAAVQPQDSAEVTAGCLESRRASLPILDSADDMTSGGRTPHSSVSEFGTAYNPEQPGEEPAQPALLGLAERQDSANYQPRPPALAERQDSAQNLQALAEAEAELAAAGADQLALERQDSAHELDDTRSISPNFRRSQSAGPTARQPSLRNSLSTGEARARSPNVAVAGVSPRQDSASGRQAGRRPDVDEPFSQPMVRQRLSPDRLATSFAGASALGSTSEIQAEPDSSRQPGIDLAPQRSLEAARRLHQAAGLSPPLSPSPFDSDMAPTGSTAVRQDSALDSLAEARRAVFAELPHVGSVPVTTSDPLQQARQLVQTSGLASPSRSQQSALEADLSLPPDRQGSARSTLIEARQSLFGPSSPFDRPVTPLSPRWTLSQLHGSFSQQLPRISSGVPWTPTNGVEQPSPGERLLARQFSDAEELEPGRAAQEGGSLLAEARRAVLGGTAAKPSAAPGAEGQAGQLQPLQPKGMPTVRRTGSGLDIPAEALPGRDGEFIRETPYPDSPLAAGAEGSLRDPTFFQRQASLRETAFGDVAESSSAAALRSHA